MVKKGSENSMSLFPWNLYRKRQKIKNYKNIKNKHSNSNNDMKNLKQVTSQNEWEISGIHFSVEMAFELWALKDKKPAMERSEEEYLGKKNNQRNCPEVVQGAATRSV